MIRRAAHIVVVVLVGMAIGKMCQYAAVDYLEPRLGFDLASLIGIAPFVIGLLWLKRRYPALLAYRGLS